MQKPISLTVLLLLFSGLGVYGVLGQDEPVAIFYVFTDRHVYAPGMLVVVNVLARDAEGVPLAGVGVYVSLTDPFDRVIFEKVGNTFSNGSYVTYMLIPSDAEEGYYSLDAVALVDIVPTPSATIYILVCRLCAQYDERTSQVPSVVTVLETEYIPITTTETVVTTSTLAATTVSETIRTVVTSVATRTLTVTATLQVNPYYYIPGLAVLAFAGYLATLLVLKKRKGSGT
ncbi:hypothetical protein HRbin01_01760 [archaeon HR01]|nr:hypothetical protein HRbin01_01760 [archaeon HR01]